MITKFKIFEAIDNQEIVYTLKTKAKSGNYEYTVNILKQIDKYSKIFGIYILNIENTPASWYLSTILDNCIKLDKISIQGNDWLCDNWQEIIKELLEIYPYLEKINKYNL